MLIFPLLFLVVLFLFLFRGMGWPGCGHRRTHDREESARELLDRRYARGELSREQYQQMKKDLN
ncbi:MAG: SHOCT domain-containing protein [Gammaproteobacteria bacterium]|nr:SHOCT domain-containing protein [Gammaproteobacteria bacterium]